MQQRMQSLIHLARGAAQEQAHQPGPQATAEDSKQGASPAGLPAGAAEGGEGADRRYRGGAVLSLLGVLRGLEAAHMQPGGAGASLQRVRLLQVRMALCPSAYRLWAPKTGGMMGDAASASFRMSGLPSRKAGGRRAGAVVQLVCHWLGVGH